MSFRNQVLRCLAFGAIAGLAYPYAELAWQCRSDAASEACVWARAYFPLSRWVEPFIVTPIAFGVLLAAAAVARRAVGRR